MLPDRSRGLTTSWEDLETRKEGTGRGKKTEFGVVDVVVGEVGVFLVLLPGFLGMPRTIWWVFSGCWAS